MLPFGTYYVRRIGPDQQLVGTTEDVGTRKREGNNIVRLPFTEFNHDPLERQIIVFLSSSPGI